MVHNISVLPRLRWCWPRCAIHNNTSWFSNKPNPPKGDTVRHSQVITCSDAWTTWPRPGEFGPRLRQFLASSILISAQNLTSSPGSAFSFHSLFNVSASKHTASSTQDCYSLLSWTHDLLNHFRQTIYSHLHSATLHVRCTPQTSDVPILPRHLYEHHRTTNTEEQYGLFPDWHFIWYCATFSAVQQSQ
jgi:hypothetical protein